MFALKKKKKNGAYALVNSCIGLPRAWEGALAMDSPWNSASPHLRVHRESTFESGLADPSQGTFCRPGAPRSGCRQAGRGAARCSRRPCLAASGPPASPRTPLPVRTGSSLKPTLPSLGSAAPTLLERLGWA